MVFDEQENCYFERFNDWHHGFLDEGYRKVSKDGWAKRFKYFVCLKDETLEDLKDRYSVLLNYLKDHEIYPSNAEKLEKFADALPIEWGECLKNLREDSNFSKLALNQFISKLKAHELETRKKKKEMIKVLENNVLDLSSDVFEEMHKRVAKCVRAKYVLKYDFKRGFYIDNNGNPLDFVKIFCAGTFIAKEEEAPKAEESVKNETMCSKCDNVKTNNDKLVKDMGSLASEVKKLKDEKHTAENQILWLHEKCENLKAENDKLLNDFNSLTLKNQEFEEQMKILEDGRNVFSKNNIEKQKMITSHLQKIIELEKEGECAQMKIKKLEKELESKQKSSEDEDFWIKLENKNLKANESKFQEQIKVLENKTSVLENLKIENEDSIKSHLERISQLEKEAENSRIKIDELEKKLISFVTKSDKLNIPCPKPINSVPISDDVTNFDNVKVDDCDEKSDDKTVLQSTEKGECSKQRPLKKKVEQKQKDNKSSSDRSSNRNEKLQKVKNENSKIVGNKWCRLDHSAKASNPASLKKEYHQAKQCYDLSIWCEKGGNWFDNRMCYSCGYHGHIAVNCQYGSYETRRCYNCNIKGHIARDCPRRSNDRLRANSQKMAKKKPVVVKPKELKASGQNVKEQKVKEPKVQETKVKLSQGQKDRLRKRERRQESI
ncbi:putative transcription factor interactor and regulator CCHC(Zn) family [Helianthus anomalus]